MDNNTQTPLQNNQDNATPSVTPPTASTEPSPSPTTPTPTPPTLPTPPPQKQGLTAKKVIFAVVVLSLFLFFGSAAMFAVRDSIKDSGVIEFAEGAVGLIKPTGTLSGDTFNNDCFGFSAAGLTIKTDPKTAIKTCDNELVRTDNKDATSFVVLVYEKMTGGLDASVEENKVAFESYGYAVTETEKTVAGANAKLLMLSPTSESVYSSDRFMLFINAEGKMKSDAGKDLKGVTVSGDILTDSDNKTLDAMISSWQWN